MIKVDGDYDFSFYDFIKTFNGKRLVVSLVSTDRCRHVYVYILDQAKQ